MALSSYLVLAYLCGAVFFALHGCWRIYQQRQDFIDGTAEVQDQTGLDDQEVHHIMSFVLVVVVATRGFLWPIVIPLGWWHGRDDDDGPDGPDPPSPAPPAPPAT